jgi:hypothetical protein
MRRALLLVLLPGLLLVALLVWLLGSSAPAPVATPGSASAESKTPAPAVPDEPPSSGAARSPRSAPPSPVASSSARSEAPDPDAYRGQVTSPEGPVAQAWVGLIRSGRFPAGFTRTDSKGRFSLKAPEGSDDAEAEGSLQLRASHSGYGEAVVDALSDTLQRVAPERFAPGERKPATMALLGMINFTFAWLRPDGPMSYERYAELVIDLWERGLQAPVSRAETLQRTGT